MALLKSQKLDLLDAIVSNVTNGQSFVTWAESIAQSLVDETSAGGSSVSLGKILALRNIKVHEGSKHPNDSVYKARLVNNISHYDLFVDNDKIRSEFELNFILAHEVAHTLFYSNVSSGLEKIVPLSFGSQQIEDICDFIAICILLPRTFILQEIKQYCNEKTTLRKRNEEFIKFIIHLSMKYNVPRFYISYRLITNYQFLPDALCIEFVRDHKWYIRWVFQTDSLNERRLYIPHKSKSTRKYVSAKKSFVEMLEKIHEHARALNDTYGSIILPKTNFDHNYQGNFKQFLQSHFSKDLDIVKVYYKVNNLNSILVLFPFDGLLTRIMK